MIPSWLGDRLGPMIVRWAGVDLPQRKILEVDGAVEVEDDPITGVVRLTVAPPLGDQYALSATANLGPTNLLLEDGTELELEDGRSYSIRVRVLGSKGAGTQGCAHEVRELLAHTKGGVLTIDDNALVASKGVPGWSIAISAPGGRVLRVRCDGGVAVVHFTARLEVISLPGV